MALESGTRLGPYEILGPLGTGGMGEVFRARDVELKREVALKVLPPAFTGDPDRLARFQREAELLATLNHPHIGAIYGLQRDVTTTALVLELVEGDTLADLIAGGPIPAGVAISIAGQLVSALEAAHGCGIVHRDLKPANIKVRPDGTVKVLDFGLAKALEPAPVGMASLSPTITSPAMTHAGVIIGTAAYMSPEQARGQAADTRSDVWAFGCVLFEMLTGEKAFPGDTVSETLASVLRSEPEWARLPANTPGAIRRLLRRCLHKDRTRRLADIRDARLELEEADEPASLRSRKRRSRTRERLLWLSGVAVLTAAIAALAATRTDAPAPVPPAVDHLYFDMPATTDPVAFALSPNGRQVVFAALLDGRQQLWHYSFETGERRPLPGTAGAAHPFWSPDGRSIGFFTNERLYRMEVVGGAPRELAVAAYGLGGTWNDDDVILFTPVPDGPVTQVTEQVPFGTPLPRPPGPPASDGERLPQFLPDGRHFIYYNFGRKQVYVGAVDSTERSVIIDGAEAAAVVAPPDRLLFVRGGQLLAQSFDPHTARPVGQPQAIGRDVAIDVNGIPALSASANGSVLYRTGSGEQPRRLVIVDREGKKIRDITAAPDASYPVNPSLCPDEKQIVLNRTVTGNTGIAIVELARGVPTTLTPGPLPEIVPLCTPRGVAYATVGGGGGLISRITADSVSEILRFGPDRVAGIPLDESGAGTLLFRTLGEKSGWDIEAVGPQDARRPILASASEERTAQFSPDDNWIVYESNENAGVFEIFVRSFRQKGPPRQVSSGGGSQPRWVGDEIFYVDAEGRLNAVRARPSADGGDIELAPRPEPLFRAQLESTMQGGIAHTYDVFRGGRQFILSTFTELPAQPLTLIRNLPR